MTMKKHLIIINNIMDKFKMNITDGNLVSLKDVFGDETVFTNKFLTQEKEFLKILSAIGRDEEIESIEKQFPTSDGKYLDNLVILSNDERIAVEAQTGTSDMYHISKLPYYLDNIRDRSDAESMIGILIAEDFTQEAIDYYTTLSELPHFDLYLIKAVFVEINGDVVFTPQLISPTPTTNQFKSFKAGVTKKNRKPATPLHNENRMKIENFLEENNIEYTTKKGKRTEAVGFYIVYNSIKIQIWLSHTGNMSVALKGNHDNTEIFRNLKGYFRLKENSLHKTFEEFESAWKTIIDNL